jgi:Hint module
VPDGSDIAMNMLVAGVAVKVAAGPDVKASKVYFFSHRTNAGMHDFIRISSSSGHAITLSANHYVYANDKLTAASAVKTGDVLRTLDGPATVSVVESVRELGLFAPHTLHGDIVVNRVIASTYTRAVHPRIAHALLAPVRAAVHLGLSTEPLGAMMYEGGGGLASVSGIVAGGEYLNM